MTRINNRIRLATALVAGTAMLSVLASAQTMGRPERYRANAVNMDAGRQGTIDINIDRWSTDAERDKLMSVMLNQDADHLLDALKDMKSTGYLATPGNLRWDLRFARKVALPDGGDRIVLVTDRPISFSEAANLPRSLDYPFTLIELHVNRDGEGEGKMSVATKIIADKEANIVTLENYGTQPVMLTLVHREKASQ